MDREIRDLIRKMSLANPLWGAPRIHGELLKLGIDVSQATVGRYLPWRPKVPSPTWRSFLQNHMHDTAAVDMFVVVTARFQLLYALVVLGHERRKVIHFDVTQNPTQVWLARQITEAFPWDTAPRFLLRDRDASYGQTFRDRVQAMAIEEVVTAPRSPWQNAYVERIIGSIRRECLDHVIVFDERHLRRVLSAYFEYHHHSRTHLSLAKDCPEPRPIQPPSAGTVVAFPFKALRGEGRKRKRRPSGWAASRTPSFHCRKLNAALTSPVPLKRRQVGYLPIGSVVTASPDLSFQIRTRFWRHGGAPLLHPSASPTSSL